MIQCSSRRNKIHPRGNPAIVRSIPAVFPQHSYPHPRETRGFPPSPSPCTLLVRSQCQSQWERPNFAPPNPPKLLNQFRCCAKYITMSPMQSMCKIWLASICCYRSAHAWKKHVFLWILKINIPIYLSVSSLWLPVSLGVIIMFHGSNNVFSQPLVPSGSH